jgi:hypothetical protein
VKSGCFWCKPRVLVRDVFWCGASVTVDEHAGVCMQSNLGAGILIWRAGGEGERMTATWRTQGVRNTREGKFDRLDDSYEEDSGYTGIQHQKITEVLSIIKFSLSFGSLRENVR